MRIVLFFVLLGGLFVGLTQVGPLRSRVPVFEKFPRLALRSASEEHIAIDVDTLETTNEDEQSEQPEATAKRSLLPGKVAGISTERLASVFTGIGSAVSHGVAAVISSSPGPEDVIDVSKVVLDITNRVEAIPSSALSTAKVAYCRQVLEQSTRSAAISQPTPTP